MVYILYFLKILEPSWLICMASTLKGIFFNEFHVISINLTFYLLHFLFVCAFVYSPTHPSIYVIVFLNH